MSLDRGCARRCTPGSRRRATPNPRRGTSRGCSPARARAPARPGAWREEAWPSARVTRRAKAAGDGAAPSPWATGCEGPRLSVARLPQPRTRVARKKRAIGPGRVARPRVTASFIASNRRGRHCQAGTVLNGSASRGAAAVEPGKQTALRARARSGSPGASSASRPSSRSSRTRCRAPVPRAAATGRRPRRVRSRGTALQVAARVRAFARAIESTPDRFSSRRSKAARPGADIRPSAFSSPTRFMFTRLHMLRALRGREALV